MANTPVWRTTKKLGITTLEKRRLRGDLIEVFKIFKVFDDIKHTDFFTRSFTRLRGHGLKLFKPQLCLDSDSDSDEYSFHPDGYHNEAVDGWRQVDARKYFFLQLE